ncbi:hypothetical protein [Ectopseudomonas alcaliphila]|uniref:hypothetical protein n=1 Tax=Ectopseudomonas alcaliphila TaxID=101564 RepID=UPI002780C620|nr:MULTISPECIES: hypothetical protein [Pseudomonas]MDP9941332.1 hypothetical protein [Pseudomonas sp. 3400]MDR7013551.1 hypothetical protein [Pseudomonas alcaliphila]
MKKIILIIIGIVLLVGSFVLGACVGITAFLQADAQFRASIATYNLKALDANRLDALRTSLELDVDGNLWLYSKGVNNPFLVLWPELTSQGIESLKHTASYRYQNPRGYASQKVLKAMSVEEQDRLINQGQKIEALVQKYGK